MPQRQHSRGLGIAVARAPWKRGRALPSLARAAPRELMSSPLRSVLVSLDSVVSEAQRSARRVFARAEDVRLLPYRGWVTPEKAVVLGRTVLADVALEARLAHMPRLARVAYERFLTLETSAAAVRVSWSGQELSASSDAAGFIDVSFALSQPPLEKTHAQLRLAADSAATATGTAAVSAEVFGLSPAASFGVISDIDDTVLDTELTNPYKRALQLIYSEQRMRLPFDGIAALYQAFAQRNNPIFYVSNAPWNLYGHVAELLDQHEIPKGPLLLRDSRLAERIVPESPGGELLVHKQRALRRIVTDHPRLPFVMLGDSSRRDPLRYVEVAEAYPGRVRSEEHTSELQ